jgi:16S rRNA (uracil1498-N3)-methyltransferase
MNTFYVNDIKNGVRELQDDEAKHCLIVLRLKTGDEIRIVDGIGGIYRSKLTQVDKKACSFAVIEEIHTEEKPFRIHLAIAPTKNIDRIEWMIEKLGEMGVDEVSFIRTEHSERSKLRIDRLEKKAISAMKQCGSAFLMKINDLTPFKNFLTTRSEDLRYIAHVDSKHPYLTTIVKAKKSVVLLIGPEGDFSESELVLSTNKGFVPISLGKNTLRTETAGMVACQAINIVNRY